MAGKNYALLGSARKFSRRSEEWWFVAFQVESCAVLCIYYNDTRSWLLFIFWRYSFERKIIKLVDNFV